jgi:putative endonuclease
MPRNYFVYILANNSRELYIGVTNSVWRRLAEHRAQSQPDSYTARHETKRLVYVEMTEDIRAAIRREKQIKGWKRIRKIELIETSNPEWRDLGEDLVV